MHRLAQRLKTQVSVCVCVCPVLKLEQCYPKGVGLWHPKIYSGHVIYGLELVLAHTWKAKRKLLRTNEHCKLYTNHKLICGQDITVHAPHHNK